jgi:hypothetical protein
MAASTTFDDLMSHGMLGGAGIALARISVRTWLVRGFLALIFLMSFRTFQAFPGMLYVQELWFVFCWLAFVFLYLPWKTRMGLRFSALEGYVLVLMFAALFLPAWRAWREFGQPISYGILRGRGVALFGVGLLLVNALRKRMVQLAYIEAALLFLAWGTFALYSLMRLTLNPASYAAYGDAFVVVGSSLGDASFKLPPHFIIYGAIYYALRGIRTRRIKFYIAAAILFLFGAVGLTERGLTICFGMTLLFFLFRWRRAGAFAIAVGKFLCIAAVAIAIAWIVTPTLVSNRVAMFSDAFTVVFTGSNVEDPSANARLLESALALPYIQEHPLFGNGMISSQWRGGSRGAVGGYFHEDDIGVVGVLFSYGALGLLMFAWQYRFALSSASKLKTILHNPLLDATKGFLLFTALISVTTGFCAWSAEVTLFFVALLTAMVQEMQITKESEQLERKV